MDKRLARRTFLSGIAASVAAALLAACGGSKAAETPKPAVTAPASTPATAASTSGTAAPVNTPTSAAGAPTATPAATVAPAFNRPFVEAEGYSIGTKIINSGIAINTTANLPKPATWKDLVKPEYKGKLVSPSPQYSGAAALNYTAFLNTTGYGADFLK